MATKLDHLKWELYCKKWDALFMYGIKTGKIHSYEVDLIEQLRSVRYGGIPASIVLLCHRLCCGHCYDRGLLITFGFGDDNFQLVDADIDGIRLRPDYVDEAKRRGDPHFSNHCFAERTKKDGSVWVYDTTAGLVFEKRLYYMMERPRITKVNSKQDTMDYIEYQDIKNADPSRDRYSARMLLHFYEEIIGREGENEIYAEVLKEEIARFKREIDYDGLCQEIDEDMRRLGLRPKNQNT